MKLPRALSTHRARRNILSTVIFVATTFGVLLAVQSTSTAASGIWSTPHELLEAFGSADSGSYMRLALDFQDLKIEPENLWILNLWPPGMPILLSILILIPAPLTIIIAAVVSMVWTLPTFFLLDFFLKRDKIAFILTWVVLWHANPVFWNWLLSAGIFFSEPIGLGLMATSSVLVMKATMPRGDNSRIELLVAGATAAASLHFRPTLLVPLLTVGLICAVWIFARNLQRQHNLVARAKKIFISSLPFVFTFLALTAPWTFVAFTFLHPGNPTWILNDYLWGQRWMSSAYLDSIGGQFLVEGGANWACLLDSERCRELEPIAQQQISENFEMLKMLSIETALMNPLAFLELRLVNIYQAWLTLPGNAIGSSMNPMVFTSATILAFLIFYTIFKKKCYKENFLFGAAVISQLIVLIIAHTETRYLLSIHVTLILWIGFQFLSLERNRTN